MEKQFYSSTGLYLYIVSTKKIEKLTPLHDQKKDSVHDIAIHFYINLPGYNTPPEAMHSDTNVMKSHNGEKKNIDGYFAYENFFGHMYVVKYTDIKKQIENDQLEKKYKFQYDPNNDASYQQVFK